GARRARAAVALPRAVSPPDRPARQAPALVTFHVELRLVVPPGTFLALVVEGCQDGAVAEGADRGRAIFEKLRAAGADAAEEAPVVVEEAPAVEVVADESNTAAEPAPLPPPDLPPLPAPEGLELPA